MQAKTGLMRSAIEAAMQYLVRRDHAVSELQVKLLHKGYSADEVEVAIKRCQEQGYQSDARYAESLIRTRISQGWGPVRVQQELASVRVEDDIVLALMATYHDKWLLEARVVWQKKFKGIKPLDYKDTQKQKRFLQYRGFTHESIAALFARLDDIDH